MTLKSKFSLANFSKKNKPISISISISISILILIVVISIIAGFYVVSKNIETEKAFARIERENVEGTIQLSSASRALWELRFALPNYVTEGAEHREKIKNDYSKWNDTVQLSLEEYGKSHQSSFEIEAMASFRHHYGEYIKYRPKYFELLDIGKVDEANIYRLKYTKPAAGKSVDALESLIKYQQIESRKEGAIIRGALEKTRKVMIFYFISESLLCVGLLLAFNNSKKRLEDSLMKMANSSKMASLGEVAAGIAHEINNPLAIIAGTNSSIRSSLKKENPSIPDIIKLTDTIERITIRTAKIIKGLRSFSRDADQDPMENRPLEYLIDDTLIFYHEKFKNHSIQLEKNITESGMFAIKCREVQISQVFVNLLNNAFDAVKNMPEPWIKIEAHYSPKDVIIRITDSGSGIPLHIKNKIFQPFFTTKEVGQGTGIGLGISKRIINEHGGTIEIDEEMKNTCFVIKLPTLKLDINLDFDAAIKAHSAWKQKLGAYLRNPDQSLKALDVALDNQCDLGKWIYGEGAKYSTFPEFKILITEHAKFHKCASLIITEADSGKSVTEETMIGSTNEFSKTSSNVINSLMKMKNMNNSFQD